MLALIAGTGDLPAALVQRLPTRPFICAMEGFRPTITPDVTFRIEHLGSLLIDLESRGITEVCMAGAVRRPSVDPSEVDEATQPLVPRIMAAMSQGDDVALRIVISVFEGAGLDVVAAHEIAPALLPNTGILSRTRTNFDQKRDAVTAERVLAQMGRADVGQACIVRNGRVLAREGQSGTDLMLMRFAPIGSASWDPLDGLGTVLGSAAEWLSGPTGEPRDARGGILFKGPKPNQDRRADLPVIGPETAQAVVAAGLSGIVIEAQGVMVLGLDDVLRILDAAGAFLWVRPKGGI